MVVAPSLISACKSNDDDDIISPFACEPSPTETAGPFPIVSPSSLVKSNIVGDRDGIPLVIRLTVQDTNNDCEPAKDIKVDVWMCDAKGNYSEYNNQLDGDFTTKHFLRGRQVTNANGEVTFVGVYPGWYPGRAPHIHVELKDSNNQSLLVTQIAFPEDVSKEVYATSAYKGVYDTSNTSDGTFGSSLNRNMANSVAGDINSGYTLFKIIKASI